MATQTKYQCERCGGVVYSEDTMNDGGYYDVCSRCGLVEYARLSHGQQGEYERVRYLGSGAHKIQFPGISEAILGPLFSSYIPGKRAFANAPVGEFELQVVMSMADKKNSYIVFFDETMRSDQLFLIWGDDRPKDGDGLPKRAHFLGGIVVSDVIVEGDNGIWMTRI